MIYVPLFGSYHNLQRVRDVRIISEAFYMGILFTVSPYHFFLYLNKFKSRSVLFLAIASFFKIIRAVAV